MTITLPRTFCVTRRLDSPGWPKDRLHELHAKGPRPAGSRWPATDALLRADGIHAEPFWCIDWQISGLQTSHKYEVDHPGSGYVTHPMRICNCLSQYMLWRTLSYLPDDEFLVLEDDARFRPGWRDGWLRARRALPEDWDLLFIGSCNCEGKPTRLIGENVFHVEWPFCTHAYLVRKKALPVLDITMQKMWAPIDLALNFHTYPKLNVYTVLPRLVDQFETNLSP